MAPTLGVCRDGEKGATSPVGHHLSQHPRVGVQSRVPPALLGSVPVPSPSFLEYWAILGCVYVCACPLQSTLGSSRPGVLAGHCTWQWCRTKASLAPLTSLRCPKRSLWLAPVNVPDRSVSVPWFVLTSSPRGAECHRICPAASPGSTLVWQVMPVGFLFFFFPIFLELQVLMGPNPHTLGKSSVLAPGLEQLLNENKTRIF